MGEEEEEEEERGKEGGREGGREEEEEERGRYIRGRRNKMRARRGII